MTPSPPTVCVITATTGHPNLAKCIASVQQQTHRAIEHLIVVDGPEWDQRVDAIFSGLSDRRGLKVIRLPHATGKDTWCGHRIYGATPFIVLTDWICWLDDDNWFDPEHVQSLIHAATAANAQWAFSLRKIVDADGKLIAPDQCESLGNLHHTFIAPNDNLVDVSCYLLKRDLAIQLSWVWNRCARRKKGEGPGPDRLLCKILMDNFPNGASTRKYTCNYTVGNTTASKAAEFFINGNQIMHNKYPQSLPWEK